MIKSTVKICHLILSLHLLCSIFISSSAAADKKTIGVILIPDIPYYEKIHKAFTQTLSARGMTADKVELIILKPLPDPISLMNTVRKFVAIDTNVIVSYGAPSALASVNEQSDIPVVFAGVFDPKAVGISLENATGMSSRVPLTTLLKHLKSVSDFSKLGVIYSATEKDTILQADEAKRLEGIIGFTTVRFNITKVDHTTRISDVDALLLTTSCPVTYCITSIIDIARKASIPSVALQSGNEEDGLVLVQSANPEEQGRTAAEKVINIINGAKASSLSVEIPSNVDLIINLNEASNLGLKVPFDLLGSATRIIK